jgi:hypothetical protein
MQSNSTNSQDPAEKQQSSRRDTGSISVGGNVDRSSLVAGNQNSIQQINYAVHNAAVSVDEIAKAFAVIRQALEREQDKEKKDRTEAYVGKLETEARKDEQQVDPHNVEAWFTTLAELSADAWEVAIATLSSPIAGISTVFRKVVQRIKEQKVQQGK